MTPKQKDWVTRLLNDLVREQAAELHNLLGKLKDSNLKSNKKVWLEF